jgi:hypothetical protein
MQLQERRLLLPYQSLFFHQHRLVFACRQNLQSLLPALSVQKHFHFFSTTVCNMAESAKHSTSALLSPFFMAANNLFIVVFTESSADWAFTLKVKKNKQATTETHFFMRKFYVSNCMMRFLRDGSHRCKRNDTF